MLIAYNIIQLLGLIVFAPILFVKTILTPKYRGRIPRRLGIGLNSLVSAKPLGRPRIWIHALSLGEVSSSESLVKAIRSALPEATVLFSASTRAGEQHAQAILAGYVDLFVPFPLDLWWSVHRSVTALEPDLFILVETDFWPNFLSALQTRRIPSVLVNGRVSQKSFARYRRFRQFFLPLFDSFKFIAMQTEEDANKMVSLGIQPRKIKPLGNLKYDAVIPTTASQNKAIAAEDFGIPPQAKIWVAGSTHAGEEEIILKVYKRLSALLPDLFLIIAPRDVERGHKVLSLARQQGLNAVTRSSGPANQNGDVLILDTLGELAGLYSLCDVAFVGGSLVPQGGHNPVEPAAFGKPILFGPHMDDFAEITDDLLTKGGGIMVENDEQMFDRLNRLLTDAEARERMGGQAKALVNQQQGVTARHIQLVFELLGKGKAQ